MTNFKFPPPPPPPPKASPASDTQNSYSSQRGGRGRGGADGGHDRGRGGPAGRGNFQGNVRGGYGQGDRGRNTHPRGGPRGGSQQQHSGRGNFQNHGGYDSSTLHQYQQPVPQSTHSQYSSAYNPTLSSPALNGVQAPPAANHNFMFHHPRSHEPRPFSSQPPHSPPSGINKRKREERQTQYEAKQKNVSGGSVQPPSKKPPRAKCKAAPEVPSFGFTLPNTPAARPPPSTKPTSQPPQQKSKVKLGLTNGEDVHHDSDEEDVDEEAAFAHKYKVEGVMFEHNGESISLQTQAEVAAWIKDRRKQFPTQKRIMQKAEEAAAKRASELEFLRKIKGKSAVQKEASDPQSAQVKKNKRKRKPATRVKPDLEEPPSKLPRESMAKANAPPQAKVKPKSDVLDLSLGYASDTSSASNESSVLSDSSVLSSSSEDSESSSDDEDAEDSDAPPETQAVNVPIAPIAVPPPPPTPRQAKPKKVDVCTQWQKTGKCKYGRHCKHPHPKEGEAKRMGLYERMVEQELEKADRLALDAIKYLGRNGFLG